MLESILNRNFLNLSMVKAKDRLWNVLSDPRLSIAKSNPGLSAQHRKSKHESPK